MKIAFICDNLSYRGGNIKQIIELANYFSAQGIKVVVFATSYSPKNCFPEIKKNFEIRNMNFNSHNSIILRPFINRVSKIRKMEKLLSKEKGNINVLIVHDSPYYMLFKYIRRKFAESILIWHVNDMPIPFDIILKKSFNSPFYLKVLTGPLRIIDKYYIRQVKFITTLSNKNKENIKNLFNSNSIVVNTGTDVFFSQKRRKKDLSRKKEINLLTVGAFYRNRRYEDIIEAISILRKSKTSKKYFLKIIGFSGSDFNYYLSVKDLVDKLGLQKHVTFIEKIDNNQLKKEYFDADIYVQSTDHIGWTIPATEAMLSELPAIITNNCGLNEVVRNGKEALIINPKRPDLIIKNVTKLVEDKKLYETVSEAGKKFVLEKLTWKQYCQKYLTLVNKIVNESHANLY